MTTPLFDLFLPQLRMSFDTILERVLAAESAGFHTVWFMDHLAAPLKADADVFDAWTLAAALAVRTERIRIGHLVLADAFRHPAVLAKQIATVDVLSAGRVDWGYGWGSLPDEFVRFGITSDKGAARAARMRESIAVIRALHGGEAVDHSGAHFTLVGAQQRPTPVQDPVPLTIGGGGRKRTLPMVAEFADWWNCPSYAVDTFPDLAAHIGDARISVQRPVGLLTDPASADADRATAERRYGAWGGLVVGAADEVATALQTDTERGAERFVLQFHDFAPPATLGAFGRDVIATWV